MDQRQDVHKKVGTPTVHVVLVAPHLDLDGGVSHYTRLLLENMDPTHVCFTYIPIGRSSMTSPWWRRPFEYVTSLWHFTVALLQKPSNLIHLNPSLTWTSLPMNLFLLLLTKCFTRKSVLLFFRGWDVEIGNNLSRKALRWRLLRWLLSWADAYLVLSKQFKEQLVRAGFALEDITVTSVMVKMAVFAPVETCFAARDERPFSALFLSRLIHTKGAHHVLDAALWWRMQHPDRPIRFMIAGDGPEMHKLIARKRSCGLENVVFTGYVRDKEKICLLESSDVFLFPSKHAEGFPNAVLEALAAGLPVIYTPVGALRHILCAQNGVRIDKDALAGESIGKALWTLYRDRTRRLAMGVHNRRLVQKHYDVQIVCKKMALIYRNVCGAE